MRYKAELECLRLTSDGSGLGYLEGIATFVPGLLPGETGEIEVYQRKSRYQKARLIKVLNPCLIRKDPPCSVYEDCGGCRLQHMEYAETLIWKRHWVEDALQRIGKIDVKVNPVLGMDFPWRYRNKARLHRDKTGLIGYYRERSNTSVSFKDCLLLSESMNKWIHATANKLNKDFPGISDVVFRQTLNKEGLILFEGLPNEIDTSELMKVLDKDYLLSNSIHSAWGLSESGVPVHLWGEKELEVSLQGLNFKVSPLAFLQVNPIMTEKLYSLVLEWAGLTGGEIVWDLYSGIGTLTLAIARKAGKAIGIEENPFAVEDAKQNARINNINNVEFFTGKVEDLLAGDYENLSQKPKLVVLDPPRAGLQPEVTETLLKVKPERIIYVSCDPGTLARDAGRLVQGGYWVERVQPVDMFPWTQHVESIIMMTYSGQKGK